MNTFHRFINRFRNPAKLQSEAGYYLSSLVSWSMSICDIYSISSCRWARYRLSKRWTTHHYRTLRRKNSSGTLVALSHMMESDRCNLQKRGRSNTVSPEYGHAKPGARHTSSRDSIIDPSAVLPHRGGVCAASCTSRPSANPWRRCPATPAEDGRHNLEAVICDRSYL